MTVAVIIQARMNSTRLPGKIVAPILGHPLITFPMVRLNRCKAVQAFVLATTLEDADHEVARIGYDQEWTVIRGSENDVLGRYYMAARSVDASVIVRITADCPLIDPVMVDHAVREFQRLRPDHLTYYGVADGMNCEVFSRVCLEIMFEEAQEARDREHVTLYAVNRPERFMQVGLPPPDNRDTSHRRWTVDEAPDLELVRAILEALWPVNQNFTMQDIIAFLDANPHLEELNRSVQQNDADHIASLYQRLAKNPWAAR